MKKSHLAVLLVTMLTLSLQSCGIFKKDCGCPSPTSVPKKR